MATPGGVLESMRQAIDAVVPCDVASTRLETQRPYIVLNFLPVQLNESSLSGGTQILDLYVTMTAVGSNKEQARLAMEKAVNVVASSWQEPALLGLPEVTPGGYVKEEEGTWRADSTITMRMQ